MSSDLENMTLRAVYQIVDRVHEENNLSLIEEKEFRKNQHITFYHPTSDASDESNSRCLMVFQYEDIRFTYACQYNPNWKNNPNVVDPYSNFRLPSTHQRAGEAMDLGLHGVSVQFYSALDDNGREFIRFGLDIYDEVEEGEKVEGGKEGVEDDEGREEEKMVVQEPIHEGSEGFREEEEEGGDYYDGVVRIWGYAKYAGDKLPSAGQCVMSEEESARCYDAA